MQWLAVCVLVTALYSGGGVTQISDNHFWADYKVFDQVYGKVFDKDIYGDTLPSSVSYGADRSTQASEKKELYAYPKNAQNYDPYDLGDKQNFLKKEKPATSTFNFLSYSGFKPISQSNDPETYNYLKRLEEAEREKTAGYSKVGGFKPYANDVNPEETYAYKVIQNILDAHEANKGSDDKDGEDDENSKYLSYRAKNTKKANYKKPPRISNEVSKPRCLPGRCRKRSSASSRVRSRPYYTRRRIKHRIY